MNGENENPANSIFRLKPEGVAPLDKLFKIDIHLKVPMFTVHSAYVPEVDPDYHFDPNATKSILAAFSHNLRLLITGRHGTGKSSHIQQVAARLNWPCIRINLDGHLSRSDFLGRNTIVIENDKQVTRFQEGLLPWAMQNPVALILDEYDAGQPDFLFILQQVLEPRGCLTLLETNKIIRPNPYFRLFATANTLGLGDETGLYHGTQQINQAQLDRWNIFLELNYLNPADELKVLISKVPLFNNAENINIAKRLIAFANMTRSGFAEGDIALAMSLRTVLYWAQNILYFDDLTDAFRVTFYNRCEKMDRKIIAEYYQRCFDVEI